MTANELKTARLALGLNRAELARQLDTPYRTYQDWEAGISPVPGVAGVAVGLLQERDRWVMATIKADIAAKLDREFPQGIRSEVVNGIDED